MVPMSECVNIMVTYVNGHETPPNCSVTFKCTTDTIEPQIKIVNGISLCTSVTAHESYNVFAIDGDVDVEAEDLNMLAALAPATVTNISVANFSPPTTTVSLTGLPHSVVYFTLHVWSCFNAAVTPTTTMITTVESDSIVAIAAGECRYIKIKFLPDCLQFNFL